MNRGFVFLLLLLGATVLRPVGSQLRTDAHHEGVATAVGGGTRSLLASLVWLRGYAAWERQEPDTTAALLQTAVALDGRALSFWLNGARILAYDVPEWRIAAAGGADALPRAVVARWREEQAQAALRYLARGRSVHAERAAFWIEEGNLHLYRRGDIEAALAAYRAAAEEPSAPFVARRIEAELLRRLGRTAEAYRSLVREHPRLLAVTGPDRERAMPEEVLARIRQLEAELGLPPSETYVPPALPVMSL